MRSDSTSFCAPAHATVNLVLEMRRANGRYAASGNPKYAHQVPACGSEQSCGACRDTVREITVIAVPRFSPTAAQGVEIIVADIHWPHEESRGGIKMQISSFGPHQIGCSTLYHPAPGARGFSR